MSLKKWYNVEENQFGASNQNPLAHPNVHFRFFYSTIECGGLDEIAHDLATKFKDVEFDDDLSNDLKNMYSFFNANHPKNGLSKKNNLISGM